MEGLTRPLLKLYWKYLQERKVEEIKQQIRMLGGKVEDEKTLKNKKEMAERKVKDPLADFPNDIEYLTESQCKEKVNISQRFGKKWPHEKIWDTYRMQACSGRFGLVARRASMNDTLWGMWMKAVSLGKGLTLDDLKKRIKFDYARSKLYPPDYSGDGSDPPPQEYLEKLKARGELAKIYAEMEGC